MSNDTCNYLYGFAHSQSTQASFDLMRHVISPLPQQQQPIRGFNVMLLFARWVSNAVI